MSLNYNHDISYLLVNRRKSISYKFKANNKIVNFSNQFCLGSISNMSDTVKSKEVSLKGRTDDFIVDDNATDISDILMIHKYLMVKNNMKY